MSRVIILVSLNPGSVSLAAPSLLTSLSFDLDVTHYRRIYTTRENVESSAKLPAPLVSLITTAFYRTNYPRARAAGARVFFISTLSDDRGTRGLVRFCKVHVPPRKISRTRIFTFKPNIMQTGHNKAGKKETERERNGETERGKEEEEVCRPGRARARRMIAELSPGDAA